ncbi:hypothetical protein [Nostoc commune]|nr:hypothetical protein [Nostoc commune]
MKAKEGVYATVKHGKILPSVQDLKTYSSTGRKLRPKNLEEISPRTFVQT